MAIFSPVETPAGRGAGGSGEIRQIRRVATRGPERFSHQLCGGHLEL